MKVRKMPCWFREDAVAAVVLIDAHVDAHAVVLAAAHVFASAAVFSTVSSTASSVAVAAPVVSRL
ncbi:MAG TPA: hypothetical protein VEZ13_05820 [Brevibacillus sp.]|nr:hypothetical protein [Brevibacillus sp.]